MIYKLYTEDGLRAELEECLSSETRPNEKMELILLKQAILRFHSHGMTDEDLDKERLHYCIIEIVKDNYDNIPKLINEFNGLIISNVNLFRFRNAMKSNIISEILDDELDRLKNEADRIKENNNEQVSE